MSDNELAGDFVLYLFHNKLIQKNAIASRQLVRNKFKVYLRENHKRCADSVDVLLTEHGFVFKTNDPNLFKFSFRDIFKYRNNLMERLDEQQIENKSCGKLKYDVNLMENALEEVKPQVDPNSKLYDLTFKLRIKQDVDEDFTLTSKGCYCCQQNYISEEEYAGHIDHHTEESDFEFMNINNLEVLPQRFHVYYRHCENSHLLLFTIKDLLHSHKSNIIIDKIILFRSSSIQYLEENVPYDLLSNGNEFYVDCHLFHLMYEQPFIIIYKFKDDELARYLEEHHFLRDEYFPLVANLLTNHVFRRGELEIKEALNDYYPTEAAKALCSHNIDNNMIDKYEPTIRNYFSDIDPLNSDNICDVFRILLEMEDFTITRMYARYKQDSIEIKGAGADYSVKLRTLANDQSLESVIKPGDQIKLTSRNSRNKENKPIQYNGFITRIAGMRIYFESKYRNIPTDEIYNVSFAPQRLSIIFQHRALAFLQFNQDLRNRLFPMGSILKSSSHIRLDFFNSDISKNTDQREAVQNIVDNSNRHIIPFVIFGPPGTGKTTVIVESILQLWNKSKGNKILVAAGSNAACDEIAARLCKSIQKIDPNSMALLRIFSVSADNRSDNLDKNVFEASNLCYGQQFYPCLDTIYTYAIVIATLTVTGKLVHGKIASDHFTHVFIDECGASTEVESIVGISGILSSSGHLIVSGDPKQLGPIIQSDRAAKFGLERSLLERLMDRKCYQKDPITNEYNKSIQARLVNNYRNHKDILHISNLLYYDGDLMVMAPAEITNWALGWCGLRCKSFPIVFESVKGEAKKLNTTSLCNFSELHSVINYVKDLIFFGVNGRRITENDIGIISPYKKQCSLIRCELDKRGWFAIETGSVETFQGQEKPIIIASMVRSKTKTAGFLDNPKRLNVLLTRAQALLIIVGNPETLGRIDGWRELIEYCVENNAFIGVRFDNSDTKSNNSLSPAQSFQSLSIASKNNNANYKHAKNKMKGQQFNDNDKHGQRKNKLQNQSQPHPQLGSQPKKWQKKNQPKLQQNQTFQNSGVPKEPEHGIIDWIDSLPTLDKSFPKADVIVGTERDSHNEATAFNKKPSRSKSGTLSNWNPFEEVSEDRSSKPKPSTTVKPFNSHMKKNQNQADPNADGLRVKPLDFSTDIRRHADPYNDGIRVKPLNTSSMIRMNSLDTSIPLKPLGSFPKNFQDHRTDKPRPFPNKLQQNRSVSTSSQLQHVTSSYGTENRSATAPFQAPLMRQNSPLDQGSTSYGTSSNFEIINRNQMPIFEERFPADRFTQDGRNPTSGSTYRNQAHINFVRTSKDDKKDKNCVIS